MRVLRLLLLTFAALSAMPVDAQRQPVEVEMNNVDLHTSSDVTIHIRHLHGRFDAASGREVPFLDDKTTYQVAVDTGVVAIDMSSLNALVSRTLSGDTANVKDLKLSVDDEGNLKQKGKIDKAIPFTVTSTIDATRDGRIRVHTQSVKGLGIPMQGLMKLFHLELDDVMRVKPGHGVAVEGNDLLLDPSTVMPPPSIRGTVTAAKLEGNALVQTFGDGVPRHLSPRALGRNYIYWRGGTMAFGRLTMVDTDLELLDMDPKDPFDFSVEHWHDQLVAGYSKTTESRGLKSHMPDYNDLKKNRR